MAHVSIGPILGTDGWRVTRGVAVVDCESEGVARATASAMATGGLRIVETTFTPSKDTEAPMEEFLDVTTEERVSDLTISELKTKLASGDYDEILDEIEAAERLEDPRVGALKAIDARREQIAS